MAKMFRMVDGKHRINEPLFKSVGDTSTVRSEYDTHHGTECADEE